MQRLSTYCALAAIAAHGALSSAASAAEVILDDPFEKPGGAVNYEKPGFAQHVEGTIAAGWTDNTSWNNDLVATYSMENEGGKPFFRASITKSKAQIHRGEGWRDIDDQCTYTISLTVRRGEWGKLRTGLRYMAEPYDHIWSMDVPLERTWKTVQREFVPTLAAREVRLFLYIEGVVEFDHIKIERTPLKPPSGAGTYYLRPGDSVLALGDAITSSGGYLRLVFEDDLKRTYPTLAAGRATVRMVNEGRNGATADNTIARAVQLADQHAPNVILLCFGANDFYVSRHSFGSNMRRLVAELKKANRSITILSPPYFYTSGYPELEARVASLEMMVRELKSLAASEKITFADCFSAMKARVQEGAEDFSWGDGIRPNGRGERMMADALQKAWQYGEPLYAQE